MRNKIHFFFKFVIIFSGGFGVIFNIISSSFSFRDLAYFTHLSNLYIAIIYLVYIFCKNQENKLFNFLLYQGVLAIILTGFIYHLVLSPVIANTSLGGGGLINIFVHTLTPFLVIVERFIYGTKKSLKKMHPILWLIFPLLYFIFTLIYAKMGGLYRQGTEFESSYPYFFLNIQENGIGYFIMVVLITLLIAYGIYCINKFNIKRKRDD